jgi:hypothetical protein
VAPNVPTHTTPRDHAHACFSGFKRTARGSPHSSWIPYVTTYSFPIDKPVNTHLGGKSTVHHHVAANIQVASPPCTIHVAPPRAPFTWHRPKQSAPIHSYIKQPRNSKLLTEQGWTHTCKSPSNPKRAARLLPSCSGLPASNAPIRLSRPLMRHHIIILAPRSPAGLLRLHHNHKSLPKEPQGAGGGPS